MGERKRESASLLEEGEARIVGDHAPGQDCRRPCQGPWSMAGGNGQPMVVTI